jgi:putative peptide zinc metalloprotease protein
VRQLVPVVRFDGYHVLADLVGVPDLYARIGPVLRGMVPWKRQDQATALHPWARGVITAWVVVVAPILLFSLLVMAVMFPRLAATAAESIGHQWASLREHWSGADLAPMLLDALAIVTIALPVAGVAYLLARLVRRTGAKAWRATEDDPRARSGLVLGAACLAVALGAIWWPQGQYRPISRDEHLTLPAISGWISDAITGDFDLGAEVSGSVADAELATSIRSDVQEADAPSATSGPAGGHVFPAPPAPGPGDNQAVAVGYDDGRTVTDSATSLEWETSGEPVDNRNEAYALASCRGCRTSAVAFQVVLVVGQHSTQAPANKAVAINEQCVLCTTRALAVQLVLPLEEAPDPATRAEVESIFARSGALDSTLRDGGFEAARALVLDIEQDIAAALDLDDELAALTTTTTAAQTEATTGTGETTTTTAVVTSTTASEPTTTAPTTTTTEPSSTTTEPPTTESTAPPP